MDLGQVKRAYGDRVCLIGNVSVDALSTAEPREIEAIVRDCLKAAGEGGGYMVSSSNSIPDYARAENVRALAQAIQAYGEYPLFSSGKA